MITKNGIQSRNGTALWRPALAAVLLAALALAVARVAGADENEGRVVTVGTYNVLNLFDAAHDEGKDDYTFLPLSYPGKEEKCRAVTDPYYRKECLETDWSDSRVELKLDQLKKAVDLMGERPDFLGLQEVENDAVVGRLAKKLGYARHLTTDGPDARGIDVALLFNETSFEYLEHAEIALQGEGLPPSFTEKPTRPILRVHFRPRSGRAGVVWGVYVNHWPSQAAGPDKRMAVVQRLQKEIDLQTEKVGEGNYHVVVIGDFNTLDSETPNALHNGLMDPHWKRHLADAHQLFMATSSPEKKRMPVGSYFYPPNHSWDRLDHLFFSRNLLGKQGARVIADSFRIVAHPTLLAPFVEKDAKSFFFNATMPLAPKGYEPMTTPEQAGYSDHLPLVVKVKLGE